MQEILFTLYIFISYMDNLDTNLASDKGVVLGYIKMIHGINKN